MKTLVSIKPGPWTKKQEACNRAMDIKIEQKHQNYILELSAAAYEFLKGEIDIYFEQHSTYKLLPKHQHDNQGLCIRTLHSVRNRSNNRQLYRINLFHTTSKNTTTDICVYQVWNEDHSKISAFKSHEQYAQPQLETSIDCIACSQLFHYTCENIDPVRISQTEEEQYSCRSCSIMDIDVVNISMRSNNPIIDTEETIPKVLLEEQGSTEDYSEIGHIVKNMPDNTSKDSPTRTQITKEETGNSNTEVLDMLETNKTASYKQHN
ncbi:unnamed protein product [Mytilus edulis]|uniref:Zinc finger PHD-type domain-containing protein n=1 Tax=Mytilus edulis TaxID=6550 RepID=A0A8S3V5N8_MYTED|nr:unnamed protein product [Mytilus edulis]